MKKLAWIGSLVMLTALNLSVGHAEEPHKVGPITSESASVTMEYSEYHKGIDMVFDTPTTLTAPFDGRVESIESYDDMCYVVITNEDVGDSVAFINVHDSPLYLNEKVKMGDVIGKAGDEPIHVSYYPEGVKGEAVNPNEFLHTTGLTYKN